jgi:hypothetical protein
MLEQDKIRSLARNINGSLDGQAHIRCVQRRHIIDSVADVPDNVPGFLEREDQALLLARFDLSENIDFARLPHERGVAHRLNVAPGEDLLGVQTDLLRQIRGDQDIVAGNDLQSNTEIAQFAQGRFDPGFRRIRESDQS